VDLEHVFTVPMPVAEAWTAFNDLELIAPCFPGAVITSVDGDDFTGTAKIKLGPIALLYTGKGTWLERDEATRRVVIEANGKDKRGNGTAGATITAHLQEDGPGTRVVVNTDLRITGRPAQFGRGVIQDVGGKILDQFADCLSTRLGGEALGAPAVAAEPGGSPVTAEPGGSPVTVPESQPPAAGPEGDGELATGGDAAAAAGPSAAAPGATGPVAAPAASAAPRSAAVPVSPPVPTPTRAAPPPPPELDLGNVMGPVLLRRLGPVVAACAVTAVVTWLVARRR
jgi:carbon monoxide dehydrogenase subunit G